MTRAAGGWPSGRQRVPLWVWDVALAVGIAIVGLLPSGHEPRWAYPAAFAGGLALLARRRWPLPTLLATIPALIGGLGTIAAGAGLYALGRARPAARAVAPWLGLAMVATIAPVVYYDVRYDLGPATWGDWVVTVLVVVLITGGPAAGGALAATRMQLTASLTALRATEADRDAAVAARVRAEERNRIAREVHDIVGHYAALIAVQASALEAHAPDAETKGTAIRLRELSSDSLEEMRSAVAMWRRTGGRAVPVHESSGAGDPRDFPGTGVPQDWAPWVLQPALTARESGVQVEVGRIGELPDSTSVAALRALRRAVQEGVTNAVRHCPGAPVTVVLTSLDGTVRLQVRNPLSGARPPRDGGTGLSGLTERVRKLGGTVTAGPVDSVDGSQAEGPHWVTEVRLRRG